MEDKQVRTWELERYLLGALSEDRMEELRGLERRDPSIAAALDDLRKSNLDFLGRHPASSIVPGIVRRSRQVPAKAGRGGRRYIQWVPAALAAALVLIFVVSPGPRHRNPLLRIKGLETVDTSKAQILVFKEEGKVPVLLKNGDTVAPGDLLQLAYVPAGRTHGVIFSIDGRGLVTLHFPDGPDDSTALKAEPQVLLRTAYELDKAPEFERFFFIFASETINVRDILKKAESLARSADANKTPFLPLPPSEGQYSLVLKKGAER